MPEEHAVQLGQVGLKKKNAWVAVALLLWKRKNKSLQCPCVLGLGKLNIDVLI